MTKTHKEIALILIAMISLLLLVTPVVINAATEITGLNLIITPDKTTAALGDTITYIYTIINGNNFKLEDLVLIDDPLGAVSLNKTVLDAYSNWSATKTYTVNSTDLPGPLVNVATVKAYDPAGNLITATSNKVVIHLTNSNQPIPTKAEILLQRGVPGKGIVNAPGLQKFFNPLSQAAEHAGKKDKDSRDSNGHNGKSQNNRK
jgi:uncharacterized repeat protein (TIGR01451 family)